MTSTIKVNTIQNTCGADIIKESSNTITIGASGDTVTLASGASQSGFGRTGTVDWQTGSIKTATFTAANGEGYFANTSSGGFTMNLPAGTAGNIVSVVDYTNTFQTNNLVITPNGSQKIGGENANATLSTEGQSVTFVYVDDTEGWKNVQDSTSNTVGNPYMTATGGTITTSGNYKIHTFTGPGTFTVCNVGSGDNNIVSYLVIAGAGGGGYDRGGGGGAGGFREYKGPADCYTASPLNGNPGGTAVTVTAQAYPITVGGGGTTASTPAGPSVPSTGSNSVFSTITSAGGGGGATANYSGSTAGAGVGQNGGSGGGGTGSGPSQGSNGGTGNTPPVSPAQGTNGGPGFDGPSPSSGGGGGGAGNAAQAAAAPYGAGSGGIGVSTSITASAVKYAGGGGGGNQGPAGGGKGFGGTNPGIPTGSPQADRFGAGNGSSGVDNAGIAGTANTGGGGGGGSSGNGNGAAGGSGIVVIRYKFQT